MLDSDAARGFFQLVELFRWAVQFHAREIGHCEHFRDQSTDVLQVGENTVCAFVPFATENFVAVDAKSVEKIFFFSRSFLNETREYGLDRLHFAGMHSEIGVKADEG